MLLQKLNITEKDINLDILTNKLNNIHLEEDPVVRKILYNFFEILSKKQKCIIKNNLIIPKWIE